MVTFDENYLSIGQTNEDTLCGHYPLTCLDLKALNKIVLSLYKSRPQSSSREVRIRVPTFSVVNFSRGTLPKKRGKRHYCGTLALDLLPRITLTRPKTVQNLTWHSNLFFVFSDFRGMWASGRATIEKTSVGAPGNPLGVRHCLGDPPKRLRIGFLLVSP